MTLRRLFVVVAALGLAAGSARAQDEPSRRPGVERETVVRLAYTLGEAHALHRLCAGPQDATWYARMQRLIGEEAYDPASRQQLVESFNSGFAAREAQFPACGRRSRRAEAAVAAQGRMLAARLAAAPAGDDTP